MRQRRHTIAYARSWQPSGNRTAAHRHSSGKKPRPFSRGPPQSDASVGQVMAVVCGTKTNGPRQGCRMPRCPLRLQHRGASRLVIDGQTIAISGHARRWPPPGRAAWRFAPFFANWPVFSRLKTHEQATKDIIWLSI